MFRLAGAWRSTYAVSAAVVTTTRESAMNVAIRRLFSASDQVIPGIVRQSMILRPVEAKRPRASSIIALGSRFKLMGNNYVFLANT